THLQEVPPGLDAHVDVDAARAGGLGPANQPETLEHRLHLGGDATHRRELDPRLRIEVHAELVRVVHVAPSYSPRVQVEAAQIHRPDEVRHVHRAQLASAAPTGEGD